MTSDVSPGELTGKETGYKETMCSKVNKNDFCLATSPPLGKITEQ